MRESSDGSVPQFDVNKLIVQSFANDVISSYHISLLIIIFVCLAVVSNTTRCRRGIRANTEISFSKPF